MGGFNPREFLAETNSFDPKAFLAETGDVDAPAITTAAPLSPERQAKISAKIKAGLSPVQGMSPEEAYTNALNSKITPTVSKAASAALGAVQGATFGFGDEIAAATEAALGGRSYKEARDDHRSILKYAEQANPLSSLAGNVAGGIATSFIPGLGIAGKAAGAAKAGVSALKVAKAGAKVGGLYGLGESDADLADGDVLGAAFDTATGAAFGGATSGLLHKLMGGAPSRVFKRILPDISGGEGAETSAKLPTVKKLTERAGGEEGEPLAAALERAPKLEKALATKAASDPQKAAEAVGKHMDSIMSITSEVPKKIDAAKGGIRIATVETALANLETEVADGVRSGADKFGIRPAIQRFRENAMAEIAGGGEGADKISAKALRRLQTQAGEIAFRGDRDAPKTTRAIAGAKIWGALADVMADEAKGIEGINMDQYRTLNRDMSLWIPAKAALDERAAKLAAGRHSLSSLLAEQTSEHVGALFGAAESAHGPKARTLLGAILEDAVKIPGGATLAHLAHKARPPVIRQIDYKLAKMVKAAAAGSTRAQLEKMAVEFGLPMVTGQAVAQYMRRPSGAEAATPEIMAGAVQDEEAPEVIPDREEAE